MWFTLIILTIKCNLYLLLRYFDLRHWSHQGLVCPTHLSFPVNTLIILIQCVPFFLPDQLSWLSMITNQERKMGQFVASGKYHTKYMYIDKMYWDSPLPWLFSDTSLMFYYKARSILFIYLKMRPELADESWEGEMGLGRNNRWFTRHVSNGLINFFLWRVGVHLYMYNAKARGTTNSVK